MSAAFLTLVCLIVRFSITTYVIRKEKPKASDISYFIAFLIQAITVVVVSVPEGEIRLKFEHDRESVAVVSFRSSVGCDTGACLCCSSEYRRTSGSVV